MVRNSHQELETESRKIFSAARREIQELLKRILQSERDVMHMKKRVDIYEDIVQHIRTVIK